MYAPKGFGFSEVGDVEVFPHGDELHLFHLTLPNHDVVHHVVSSDGISWRALPAAIRTGDPGDRDDDQIWTMSVTEREGTFFMVYTALAKAEDGMVQRTALATSTDLIRWEKSDTNPVAEADPRWYEADPNESGSVSWRDPKPVLVDGTYYAAICARDKDGPLMRRGCVGIATSADLIHWEIKPPLFSPGRWWDMECPQLFTINGTWYLTAAIMEDRTQRYWMAPAPDGPFTVPPDGGILAPRGHYAGRICHWQGRDLYVCWHRPVNPTSGESVQADWTATRHPAGKFVVAPLVLTRRADKSLACSSFPNWNAYRVGSSAPLSAMPRTLVHNESITTDAGSWSLTPGAGRMDILISKEAFGDACIQGVLTLNGPTGGLAFRVDEATSEGYFIEVNAGSRDIALRKWLLIHAARTRRAWFRYEELQRGYLREPYESGATLPFQLILIGPYTELALGGEVVLATLSAERDAGRVACWVESGSIDVTDLRVRPMLLPEHRHSG